VATALGVALVPAGARAQDAARQATEDLSRETQMAAHITQQPLEADKTNWVFLPIPQSSPTLGTGATLVAAALYDRNGSPRPWVSGIAAMGTSNSSHAYGAAQQANFMDDRLRVVGAIGEAKLNLKFYGIGSDVAAQKRNIPITDEGRFILLQALYGVADHAYLGLRLQDLRLDTEVDVSSLLDEFDIVVPPIQLHHRTTTLGPAFEYDSRDNQFMPSTGTYGTLRVDIASPSLGSEVDYQHLDAEYAHYWTVRPDVVVAARASGCAVRGDVPFTELCLYGTSNDLRGYTGGQYRDRNLYAVQAEARWRFSSRWGAVAFLGTGAVARTPSDLFSDRQLPAGGLGLRWLASSRYKVDVSLDAAVGRDGSAFYVYLGQAF
jgi:hypothetical protein